MVQGKPIGKCRLETLKGVPRKLTRMADGRLADAVVKLKARRFADAHTDLQEGPSPSAGGPQGWNAPADRRR